MIVGDSICLLSLSDFRHCTFSQVRTDFCRYAPINTSCGADPLPTFSLDRTTSTPGPVTIELFQDDARTDCRLGQPELQ